MLLRHGLCCVVLLAGCGNSVKVGPPQPGELIGRVEISTDVPASGCQILLEGTPLGAQCDENGQFDVRNVPPGRWDLRLITDGGPTALPDRRVIAASNPGLISDLGAIALAKPGSIGGHIVNAGGMDLSLAVIAVPEVGAVTVPNANGGYLLDSVSPGVHEVVLITDAGTVVHANVNVLPAKVTIGADLDLGKIVPNMVSVTGKALRAGAAEGQHAGLTVDLVENINGQTINSAQTADDGTFQLTAKYGTYIVRAHDGGKPITAIIPSVVVRGSTDVHLETALAVQPTGGDLNGNGIPDDKDPDIDGDGYPNEMDAFPYDPAEHLDTDGDGVGDRSDLRSMGGNGIDHKNATPDTDGDGKLDFEDNCVKVPNPDQKDSDSDGWGDVCDNCPFVYNPDQKDSVGNGIGDACRFCKSNQDCGSGKICQFGQCLDCISSSQCGDKVCDVAKGACVACDATHLCPGTSHCGANGRCVQCNTTPDCGANMACVQNTCVPQCTSAASCLSGQFCVSGGCVQCRTTADCTGTNYCNNGSCVPQCVTSSDCTGGRACDQTTHTCVLPCSGMCMNGQTCVNSICYTICNQTQPCSAGQVCTAQGYCGPECTSTPDCAAKPFTVCTGGMCVASGMCSTDKDCPVSQICSVAFGATTGSCVPRPTTLDGNGKYSCNSSCDCKLGEVCTLKECLPDPLGMPTRYLSSTSGSASGDGKTAGTAFNALSMVSSAVANDVYAIKGGDTLSITTPQSVPVAGVTIAGGYVACAPNRWVRDDTQRSIVSNTATGGKGAFLVTGNSTVPLTKVTLYALEIDLADNTNTAPFRAVDASYAPQLTLTHMLFKFVPCTTGGRIIQGVLCQNCNNVAWTDLSTPGVAETAGNNQMHFVEIIGGSGTLTSVHVGASTEDQLWAVHLQNLSASSTVTGTTVDGINAFSTDSTSSDLVRVENAPNGTITITGSQLPFTAQPGSGTFRAIYAKAVSSLVATGPGRRLHAVGQLDERDADRHRRRGFERHRRHEHGQVPAAARRLEHAHRLQRLRSARRRHRLQQHRVRRHRLLRLPRLRRQHHQRADGAEPEQLLQPGHARPRLRSVHAQQRLLQRQRGGGHRQRVRGGRAAEWRDTDELRVRHRLDQRAHRAQPLHRRPLLRRLEYDHELQHRRALRQLRGVRREQLLRRRARALRHEHRLRHRQHARSGRRADAGHLPRHLLQRDGRVDHVRFEPDRRRALEHAPHGLQQQHQLHQSGAGGIEEQLLLVLRLGAAAGHRSGVLAHRRIRIGAAQRQPRRHRAVERLLRLDDDAARSAHRDQLGVRRQGAHRQPPRRHRHHPRRAQHDAHARHGAGHRLLRGEVARHQRLASAIAARQAAQ